MHSISKLENEIDDLRSELHHQTEKYTKLHQKYLEDKRQLEANNAQLQDWYQTDITEYQEKLDKSKEQLRTVMAERDFLRN